uniref:Uncharacterized protein n=1 Tax=Anguilla anguilla TaxID=7936 RepID=A0A0E9XAG4_ANGAN
MPSVEVYPQRDVVVYLSDQTDTQLYLGNRINLSH